MTGIMIGPDGGERIRHVGGRDHRVLLEIPALEMFELRFTPDFEGVDPHTHEAHADCFYVLEGRGRVSGRRRAGGGRAGHVRRGPGGCCARVPGGRRRRAAPAQRPGAQQRLRRPAAPPRVGRRRSRLTVRRGAVPAARQPAPARPSRLAPGVKHSTANAPSGPAVTSCGTWLAMHQVAPAVSSRVSSPIRNVIVPRTSTPSCSLS